MDCIILKCTVLNRLSGNIPHNDQHFFMKSYFLLILLGVLSLQAVAQENNKKPKIVGQDVIFTNEDESVTILMSHLDVEDDDDWFYPWGFTMQVYPGENYSLQGSVLTPARNFSGKLKVPVTVHDGQDLSNKFDLEITVNPVNDKPVITGHSALSTNENQALAITTAHLRVTDPDDKYPDDFTLKVHAGNNYTVNGNQVLPQSGFVGNLSVNVSVNDGSMESDIYALPVTVNALNRVPEITGQATLQVNEDQAVVIQLTHLTVIDQDSNYPQGFTLAVAAGENYTVSGSTVIPAPNFFGRLTVPVSVNDGKNTSKSFNLTISVTAVNDIPVISSLETEPIFYSPGDLPTPVSQTLVVSEIDGDSIMFAEVGFSDGTYQATTDKLTFNPITGSNIRAVFDPATGILTLLGQASPARYTQALRTVQYENAVQALVVNKTLYLKVNDGKSDSEIVERNLVYGEAAASLDIPRGFTPNGDLANDTWKIIPLKSEEQYADALIRIYNKDGILVYESIGFGREWDGRLNGQLLPADTYFYTIDLKTNTPAGFVKGLVTILR